MSEPARRFNVTVTVDRDGGPDPGPAEFAVAAGQIISVVTVHAADRPAAVAVALAVVSEALRRPVRRPAAAP